MARKPKWKPKLCVVPNRKNRCSIEDEYSYLKTITKVEAKIGTINCPVSSFVVNNDELIFEFRFPVPPISFADLDAIKLLLEELLEIIRNGDPVLTITLTPPPDTRVPEIPVVFVGD